MRVWEVIRRGLSPCLQGRRKGRRARGTDSGRNLTLHPPLPPSRPLSRPPSSLVDGQLDSDNRPLLRRPLLDARTKISAETFHFWKEGREGGKEGGR